LWARKIRTDALLEVAAELPKKLFHLPNAHEIKMSVQKQSCHVSPTVLMLLACIDVHRAASPLNSPDLHKRSVYEPFEFP
jgi:hypothetical protein